MKQFHLGDILSVTTGYLVAPRGVEALYELLDYMTGDSLFTHQLPRAAEECKPVLLEQHRDLADVEVPDEFSGEQHVWDWLALQVVRFGETREVSPLAPSQHQRVNPLVELAAMADGKPVLGIVVPEDGAP